MVKAQLYLQERDQSNYVPGKPLTLRSAVGNDFNRSEKQNLTMERKFCS